VKRVEGEPAALQIQAESKPKHKDQAAAAVFYTGLSHQCRTERCGQLLRDDKASARAKQQQARNLGNTQAISSFHLLFRSVC